MGSSSRVELARRALVTVALAVWWGGLTFYGAVVVPVGTEVLGGAAEQGFVTQRVVNTSAHLVVAPHAQFYGLHRAYLLVTAAQWGAGLVHLLLVGTKWPDPARDTMPRQS